MSRLDKEPAALERLKRLEKASRERLVGRMPADGAELHGSELGRLLQISWTMNQLHDRVELLAYVGRSLRELFDAGECFVLLFGESAQPARVFSSNGTPVPDTAVLSDTLLDQLRESGRPLQIDDVSEHPELRDQSSVRRNRIASVLAAPLVVDGRSIGALWFDHRVRAVPFSANDLSLLSLFADQAATAFNNLLLIERLENALADSREARDKLVRAQDELVRAERLAALGEMSAGVAHDFNNALFVALGQCDVLLGRHDLDEDTRSSLTRIRRCALDAAETVREMQRFARGQQDADRPTEAIEALPLLQDLRELTRRKWETQARERGVEIDVRIVVQDGLPRLAGSERELRDILINLIFNAAEALEEDGQILLTADLEGSRVCIAVADDGPGMDDATRQRIFEPFFTTKGAAGGVGFGLATSWNLARRMGGEIECQTEVGLGTTFKVWLPAYESLAPASPRPMHPGAPRAGGPIRVLIIDDDAAVLETVGQLLASLGHEYSAYSAPEMALKAFRERSFDAVITDLMMPGLSGAEVAEEVHRARPEVPVILLTAWGTPELESLRGESISRVLSKPLTQATLEESLSSLLAS